MLGIWDVHLIWSWNSKLRVEGNLKLNLKSKENQRNGKTEKIKIKEKSHVGSVPPYRPNSLPFMQPNISTRRRQVGRGHRPLTLTSWYHPTDWWTPIYRSMIAWWAPLVIFIRACMPKHNPRGSQKKTWSWIESVRNSSCWPSF